jgi:hypothetical protein
MDVDHRTSIRYANSMEVFADGDEKFRWGDWRAWREACLIAGQTIPPAEFKALLKAQTSSHGGQHGEF